MKDTMNACDSVSLFHVIKSKERVFPQTLDCCIKCFWSCYIADFKYFDTISIWSEWSCEKVMSALNGARGSTDRIASAQGIETNFGANVAINPRNENDLAVACWNRHCNLDTGFMCGILFVSRVWVGIEG